MTAPTGDPSCRHPFGCQAPGDGCAGPCPITAEEAARIDAEAFGPVTEDPPAGADTDAPTSDRSTTGGTNRRPGGGPPPSPAGAIPGRSVTAPTGDLPAALAAALHDGSARHIWPAERLDLLAALLPVVESYGRACAATALRDASAWLRRLGLRDQADQLGHDADAAEAGR